MPIKTTVYLEGAEQIGKVLDDIERGVIEPNELQPGSTTLLLDRPATLAERNAATRINEALMAWANDSSDENARALERALTGMTQTKGMTKRQLYDWINQTEGQSPRVGSVDAAIMEEVATTPPPSRLTPTDVNGVVQGELYSRLGYKTTVCLLLLENGFEVVGSSACVDPANFDYMWGKRLAREDAMRKVWALEGYFLQCRQAAYRGKAR